MAIKLYKSQLEPTAKSSNVANKAFASMQEAGSIGRAWKGMVQSGEKLYAKHIDIKTDNEVLEKTKEVMNGSDKFEGLSATTLRASNMNDPDKAGKYYNDQWQAIFDNVNGSLSGKMAQKKFKAWMTKQNINDVNSIKSVTTGNMIAHNRSMKLDEIETLKKRIIFPQSAIDFNSATDALNKALFGKKAEETFGNKLKEIQDATFREIALYGYKNVPISERDAALEKAKTADRLDSKDVQTLNNYFGNSIQFSTNLISDSLLDYLVLF